EGPAGRASGTTAGPLVRRTPRGAGIHRVPVRRVGVGGAAGSRGAGAVEDTAAGGGGLVGEGRGGRSAGTRPGAAPGGRTWAVDRPNGARAARVEVVPATAARPAVAWWVPDRSAGVGSGPGKGFHPPRTGGLRGGTVCRWRGSGVSRGARGARLGAG